MVFLKEPPSVLPLRTNRGGISKAAHDRLVKTGPPKQPPRISCQWVPGTIHTRRKMVASRKDLADAIQSYSDNDNHPEKMGNRQQQTNPADVAAFPNDKSL